MAAAAAPKDGELVLKIENKFTVPLPEAAPEGGEWKNHDEDGADDKPEAKAEETGGGEDGDLVNDAAEGPTDEDLALLEPPRRELRNVMFRVDMSGIAGAANFVTRAEVKDFLDIFFVVSRLLGEEWTVWTQRAALVYLHHDRWVHTHTDGLADVTVKVPTSFSTLPHPLLPGGRSSTLMCTSTSTCTP